jgi:hypothetical protein
LTFLQRARGNAGRNVKSATREGLVRSPPKMDSF